MNIPTLLVTALLIISVLLGIWVTYYCIKQIKSASKQIHLYFLVLLCAVISLYLLFILSVLSMIIISGDQWVETVDILTVVSFVTYFGLLLTVLLVFMGRLHFSYKNTQYKVRKSVLVILWGLILIIVILFIYTASIRMACVILNDKTIYHDNIGVLIADSSFLLLYVIISIILVILFSNKLRKIIITHNRQIYEQKKSNKNDTCQISDTITKKLMSEMSRYLLLCTLQFSSTVFLSILLQIHSGYFHIIYVIMDSMINVLCIILQFQFSTPLYNKYCSICDHWCQQCCSIQIIKLKEQKKDNCENDIEQTTTADLGVKLEIENTHGTDESTKESSQQTTTSDLEMYNKINKKTIANLRAAVN
eukprot:407394_1